MTLHPHVTHPLLEETGGQGHRSLVQDCLPSLEMTLSHFNSPVYLSSRQLSPDTEINHPQ